MNKVQELLYQLRDQGWIEPQLAAELGIHPMSVSRWFRGCRFPDMPKLVIEKLEVLLKIPA